MFSFNELIHHTVEKHDEIEYRKEYMLLNYFVQLTEKDKEVIKRWRIRQNPKTEEEDFYLYVLKQADEDFIKSFRIQNTEVSVNENGIYYRRGDKVGINHSLGEWKKMAEEFFPEANSKIATLKQQFLFYALRNTKYFWSIEDVCNNSSKFGNHWDSYRPTHSFESSGKRIAAGYYDGIGNTSKVCMYDDKVFAICGGYCTKNGEDWPLAGHIEFSRDLKKVYTYASVVLVCD